MRADLFDYELPSELIATRPPPERDAGRVLVVHSDGLEHRRVRDLAELIAPGSLLVVNDTRVLRARLLGRRAGTGGRVELLLLRRLSEPGARERWHALGRASKALSPGARIEADPLSAVVLARDEAGTLEVELSAEPSIDAALETVGRVPIPPYLGREDDADDVMRYQTVYADRPGSVAAPTAGLHFSDALLARLREREVHVASLTLHVGIGTFRPVTTENLEDHVIHSEQLEVSPALVASIEAARARCAKVVAVGTTVVRGLESAADPARPGCIRSMMGETQLFIQPGYRFQVVDSMVTNFHMPRSTLLALVSAFAGRERLMRAYQAAIAERYRFLSYGDAMWIPSRLAEEP